MRIVEPSALRARHGVLILRLAALLIITASCLIPGIAGWPPVFAEDNYRIAPGDRITISVYGEPDLSFDDMPVPSSGFINYPFLGQVRAEGFSEVEMAQQITRGLLDGYLLQPKVSVAVIK